MLIIFLEDRDSEDFPSSLDSDVVSLSGQVEQLFCTLLNFHGLY